MLGYNPAHYDVPEEEWCYTIDCFYFGDNDAEPCWGQVEVVPYSDDGSGGDPYDSPVMWHRCQGHKTDKYVKENEQ
jgi:hypothetical protein